MAGMNVQTHRLLIILIVRIETDQSMQWLNWGLGCMGMSSPWRTLETLSQEPSTKHYATKTKRNILFIFFLYSFNCKSRMQFWQPRCFAIQWKLMMMMMMMI